MTATPANGLTVLRTLVQRGQLVVVRHGDESASTGRVRKAQYRLA